MRIGFSVPGLSVALLSVASFALASNHLPDSDGLCSRQLSIVQTDTVHRVHLHRIKPDVTSFLRGKGPSGQPLAAQVRKEDGEGLVFGTARAIQSAKANASDHKDIVLHLGGDLREYKYIVEHQGRKVPVTVSVNPLLCGSAVHCNSYSDLDVETTLNVQYDSFKEDDLHNKDSIAARALAMFLREYVETVSALPVPGNGKPFLTDVKAGELDHIPKDQEKTKSRALKWSREDVIRGWKEVDSKSGKKIMTLAEALTTETRTKVDWIVKMKVDDSDFAEQTGIMHRYVDANVLFHIGGQTGNNEPVLRVAREDHIPELGATGGHLGIEGTGGFSPMRISTVAFTPEHASMANRFSVVTPNFHIFYIHAILLNVNRTYAEAGEILKLLKRVQRRILYWNDISVYRYFCENRINPLENCDSSMLPNDLSAARLYEDIQEIIAPNFMKNLLQLRESAKTLALKRERGAPDVEQEKDFLPKAIAFLEKNLIETGNLDTQKISRQDIGRGILQVIDLIEHVVRVRVKNGLQKHPYLNSYISFVLHPEHRFEIQDFGKRALFVAFKPELSSEFVREYERFAAKVREQMPEVELAHPSDLHMTLAFIGKVTPQVDAAIQKIVQKYQVLFREKLKNKPIHFENGSFTMIGSNHNQVGIVFDIKKLHPEILNLIQGMKYEMVRAGVVPDRHLDEFLPHISLGYIGNTRRSSGGPLSIHKIFGQGPLSEKLTRVDLPLKLELLEVAEQELNDGDAARYHSHNGSDVSEIEYYNLEDFFDRND